MTFHIIVCLFGYTTGISKLKGFLSSGLMYSTLFNYFYENFYYLFLLNAGIEPAPKFAMVLIGKKRGWRGARVGGKGSMGVICCFKFI